MQPEMVKQLKALEKENARLKKLVADQALDSEILKEVAKGNWSAPHVDGARSMKSVAVGGPRRFRSVALAACRIKHAARSVIIHERGPMNRSFFTRCDNWPDSGPGSGAIGSTSSWWSATGR